MPAEDVFQCFATVSALHHAPYTSDNPWFFVRCTSLWITYNPLHLLHQDTILRVSPIDIPPILCNAPGRTRASVPEHAHPPAMRAYTRSQARAYIHITPL